MTASPKTAGDLNCFSMEVVRNSMDTEVVIEIVHVEPPDQNAGYPGSIQIEAYTLDGKSFLLTHLEYERAIDDAISNMERWAAEAENELMDR